MRDKMLKLQRQAQEVVRWEAQQISLLGLRPTLWMEVFDKKHRPGAVLYGYWQRWELSNTEMGFFDWLESGPGSLVDLPTYPRRLLDEWHVLYLTNTQQNLFEVVIDPATGLFSWALDGTLVTLPAVASPEPPPQTERERAVDRLIRPRLEKSARRNRLLERLRSDIEQAAQLAERPAQDQVAQMTKELLDEGLLRQLVDPLFYDRLDADDQPYADMSPGSPATPASASQGLSRFRKMSMVLWEEYNARDVLPELSWSQVLDAIDHDEGRKMAGGACLADECKSVKGIFVLDKFGKLYCGPKLRGTFQHSSFVRGHCVKVAGGIKVSCGKVLELSPHSGHYQPLPEQIARMQEDWASKGVDFTSVKIKPYEK